MRGKRFLMFTGLALLSMATSSCDKRQTTNKPDVVARLCQHITENRRKMIVDTNNQPTIIWSDGAILEVGTSFPKVLEELISHPSNYHDIGSFLKQFDPEDATGWKDARVIPSTPSSRYSTVKSADGKISTSVESLYVDYLGERYPTARFRIKSEFEPIIVLVGKETKASVMPVKF